MPTVHNFTGVPATLDYATLAGPLTGHIALGVGGNAIIGNIVGGNVHAVFGLLHANGVFPGLHLNNIYIISDATEPAAVWFG